MKENKLICNASYNFIEEKFSKNILTSQLNYQIQESINLVNHTKITETNFIALNSNTLRKSVYSKRNLFIHNTQSIFIHCDILINRIKSIINEAICIQNFILNNFCYSYFRVETTLNKFLTKSALRNKEIIEISNFKNSDFILPKGFCIFSYEIIQKVIEALALSLNENYIKENAVFTTIPNFCIDESICLYDNPKLKNGRVYYKSTAIGFPSKTRKLICNGKIKSLLTEKHNLYKNIRTSSNEISFSNLEVKVKKKRFNEKVSYNFKYAANDFFIDIFTNRISGTIFGYELNNLERVYTKLDISITEFLSGVYSTGKYKIFNGHKLIEIIKWME